MTQQDTPQASSLDPIQSNLRVACGIVVSREEAVRCQPPGSHEDKDLELGLTETKAVQQQQAGRHALAATKAAAMHHVLGLLTFTSRPL
jgi:hypothetical protein